MRLGRPRQGHPEGVLGIHVMHILAAIDRLPETGDRALLRIAALLHDCGKFASLATVKGYQPVNVSVEELEELIKASCDFRKEFLATEHDPYVPEHAVFSRNFAMRFIDDQTILDLIKFHDTGWKIFEEHESRQDELLRNYFAGRDAALFVLFSYVDAVDRSKEIPLWLQRKLMTLQVLSEEVISSDQEVQQSPHG